jgi:hypothetical protein
MDIISWYVATLHGMLGHDKTAAFIGQPAGDRAECLLCIYEAHPTQENRERLLAELGRNDDGFEG